MATQDLRIHPTAIVGDNVRFLGDVEIGPYSNISGDVEIGPDCVIMSHVVIAGNTKIGSRCKFFPFCSIGHVPQDLKYKGEPSSLEIGSENVFREYVTISPGTECGSMSTKIGNSCLFMISSHVGHDCIIGNHVRLTNNVSVGGYVEIGDYAVVGGNSAVHQYIRIGDFAMIAGLSGVLKDVPPYAMLTCVHTDKLYNRVDGLIGVNMIGMKKYGFSREDIVALDSLFECIFGSTTKDAESRAQVVRNSVVNSEFKKKLISFFEGIGRRGMYTNLIK